jgi:hypothetical protein
MQLRHEDGGELEVDHRFDVLDEVDDSLSRKAVDEVRIHAIEAVLTGDPYRPEGIIGRVSSVGETQGPIVEGLDAIGECPKAHVSET